MATRTAVARSARALLAAAPRRGVSSTAPAAASSAVATTGAWLRAELDKLPRYSHNLPADAAEVLLTPEVRGDMAAIAAAEDALISSIDTTDVTVDWVCWASVPFFCCLPPNAVGSGAAAWG